MKNKSVLATLMTAAMSTGLGAAGTVQATSLPPGSALPLSYTQYQCHPEPDCTSDIFGPGADSMLTTPGIYSYSDLGLLSASSTGGVIPGSAYPAGYDGASFYDAFLIDITASQGSSISSTINLGAIYQITDFQERLYPYLGTAPTVGQAPGAIDFWTTAVDLGRSSGTVAELPATVLMPGEYVLEVRGDVTGTSGGSFSGTLQLSPVPLPDTLPLLLSGLGFLGSALRRNRTRS